ncbi:ATP-binding protein [Devosia sp.]|uniref:sensor histidine kinase n=1 Tax=Devosia sp. TaxID=1871048 RepID=UPI003A8D9876
MWQRLSQLGRTTTVRLTGLFILLFVLFAVLLLGLITYQSSVELQRVQGRAIDRETNEIVAIDRRSGLGAAIFAVERLARQPGPGIYYLADGNGQMIVGNVSDLPAAVLVENGTYSFNYVKQRPFGAPDSPDREGNAIVRSVTLDSGLTLVVGRDVVERRGYTAMIFQWFLIGVIGIVIFALLAGVITSVRVLRRIDSIASTSRKIMSGNLSERVPVTRHDDEFDALAGSLNQMLDRIEQLMQGLKEVSDNVAHDLKTPLTRMRNRAESALRDGRDGADHRAALELTIAESDQLIKTFNALLMIARAEAGAPSGALAEVDLSAVATDVAELYSPLAEDEGLTLSAEIAPDVKLRGNRELLGQALVNLIENALKYYEPQEGTAGRISVGVARAGGRVRISVADNGPGIAEADRQRVIERFVRLEKSRTEPGSGLGLSLVGAVARLHGGELRIEDNDPGVRAVIDLPTT